MTRPLRFALVASIVAVLGPAVAHGRPDGPPGGRPVFLDELFPPRVVMRHQKDIELSATQREAITKAMAATEARLVELQWSFEEQSAVLSKLFAQPVVEEGAALAQADRVLEIEHEMKKAHLALLIKIKNQLDATQQAKLRTLAVRERSGPRPGSPAEAEETPERQRPQ